MPRTIKLLYKGLIPLFLASAAMALILWEQGSQINAFHSVPWSEWILLLYGVIVTMAGYTLFQRKVKNVSEAELHPQQHEMILSKLSLPAEELDQEHLQRQLAYMQESKRQLEIQLLIQSSRLIPYMLQPLFLGGFSPEEMKKQLKALGYSLEEQQRFAVISLQIEPLGQTRFEEKDRELLYFSIQNMLEELIPATSRLRAVRLHNTLSLLVMSGSEEKKVLSSSLEGWTAAIQTSVYHYLQLKTCIGISKIFERLKDCPSAYEESVKAFKYHLWAEQKQSVYYFECLPVGQGFPYPEAHPLESEWFEAIKSGETARAGALLRQILEGTFQQMLHPLELEMSLVRLLLTFLDRMKSWRGAGPAHQPFKTSLLQEVLALGNAEEAERWFKTMLMDPSLHKIEKSMNAYKRNLLDQMVRMIHEEYDTDLSLESVASRLHYNSNYLSGVFNKQMNITFSEYLAKFRHEMARKWLIETDMPVKEIAHRLQYKNSQNFIRSFRKNQDMTPGEYRLNYGRKPIEPEKSYLPKETEEQAQES